ncbi:hypothetical protein [Sphingomonas sp.]|uniref:hypothetical protein n=1 Tax=Sphingomonas sp. TaxID=28214 RepID=UPI0035C7C39B
MTDHGAKEHVHAGIAREIELCSQVIVGLQANVSLPHDKLPTLINGRLVSERVATAIREFGIAWEQRQIGLAEALNGKDRDALVRAAFGNAWPERSDVAVEAAAKALHQRVTTALEQDIEALAGARTFHFGAWLVRDQQNLIELGPVRIIPREDWLAELEHLNTIDAVAARRVRRSWQGKRPRKRKAGRSEEVEWTVLKTVGECPDVCTVTVANMSGTVGEQKALLSARLALCAHSLLWERPSTAIEGFGLLVDGKHWNATFLATRDSDIVMTYHGRSRRMPGTTWTSDRMDQIWQEADWLRQPAGKALTAFASGRLPHERDAIDRAVFLALWWMHEAIVSDTALMATAKFGAVLDTLAGGSGKDHSIMNMLSERLGIPVHGPVTQRGKTLKQIVRQIYGRGRSTTLHGSNDQFGSDWSDTRGLAEKLARDALLATLGWVHDNDADRLPDYA